MRRNFFCLFIHLYEMMDTNLIYCGNHFTIYGNRNIMTCNLNLTVMYVNYYSIKQKKSGTLVKENLKNRYAK